MAYVLQLNEYSGHGDIERIKYLVSQGADIKYNDDYAIRCASANGHLEVVKYLVSLGANIRADDDYAVRLASSRGHLEVVTYLVSLGANIRADDDRVVKLASQKGHLEVVKYLVSLGADINMISNVHKQEIFGGKIRDFYIRQRDRKKILSIWRQIVPLYYHPLQKGGYFAKKEIEKMLDETV